ncbi:MAG: hypothetical protein LBR80_07805 [Deltaproteobacteria bacterium]|jgi:hypothetical protein|nr:hypothetical protein [Deltaproteobacteria bacterium]
MDKALSKTTPDAEASRPCRSYSSAPAPLFGLALACLAVACLELTPGVASALAEKGESFYRAYRSVATAEEALFAALGRYSTSYEELRDMAGLVADKSVCYGAIETYVDPMTGNEGYGFSVGSLGGDGQKGGGTASAYAYRGSISGDSVEIAPNDFECMPFGGTRRTEVSVTDDSPPEPAATADHPLARAFRAVAEAEERLFARTGAYTESYDELAASGLVLDPSVCYGDIETFANGDTGVPGYRFKVGLPVVEGASEAFAYDISSAEVVTRFYESFPCVRDGPSETE